MVYKLLALLVFLSTPFAIFSQEKKIQLKGNILNDSISVSDITIKNRSSKTTTKTDSTGNFTLPVLLGDTLVISAIHIITDSIFIDSVIARKKNISVKVKTKVNQLDEIVLNNILSESALDFSAALKYSSKPDLETTRRQEIQQLAETDPTKQNQGVSLMGGLGLLSKLFKKKNKPSTTQKMKHWKKFNNQFMDEFGRTFFTDDLEIPEQMVNDFLEFCRNQQKNIISKYQNNEKLDVIDFFVKQSKNYKPTRKKPSL